MTFEHQGRNPHDIVAFLVDGHKITRNYQPTGDIRLITRAHMQLMAEMGLGEKWREFADATAVATFKPGVRTNTLQRIIP